MSAVPLVEAPKQTPVQQGILDIPGCEFTPTRLKLPEGLSYDHWERIGRQLQLVDMAVQWWIGDWLVYGEQRYYERYSQALEESTGRKKHTLMNYAFVAKAIEFSRRRENVDFSTHAEVASLKPEEQELVLAKAAKEQKTIRAVRREVDQIKRAKRPKPDENAYVLSKSARTFLDEYMTELAALTDRLPSVLNASERQALENMIYGQGNQAMWQRNRTLEADYKAIVELFSFEEGTPGIERATRAEIGTWLDKCGYFMSHADLDERLDLMIGNKTLELKSLEASRQEGRRGDMVDVYALHPDYEARLEQAR